MKPIKLKSLVHEDIDYRKERNLKQLQNFVKNISRDEIKAWA